MINQEHALPHSIASSAEQTDNTDNAAVRTTPEDKVSNAPDKTSTAPQKDESNVTKIDIKSTGEEKSAAAVITKQKSKPEEVKPSPAIKDSITTLPKHATGLAEKSANGVTQAVPLSKKEAKKQRKAQEKSTTAPSTQPVQQKKQAEVAAGLPEGSLGPKANNSNQSGAKIKNEDPVSAAVVKPKQVTAAAAAVNKPKAADKNSSSSTPARPAQKQEAHQTFASAAQTPKKDPPLSSIKNGRNTHAALASSDSGLGDSASVSDNSLTDEQLAKIIAAENSPQISGMLVTFLGINIVVHAIKW